MPTKMMKRGYLSGKTCYWETIQMNLDGVQILELRRSTHSQKAIKSSFLAVISPFLPMSPVKFVVKRGTTMYLGLAPCLMQGYDLISRLCHALQARCSERWLQVKPALQQWSRAKTATCKNSTERDHIWLSLMAASLCCGVESRDVFADHSSFLSS